MSELEDDRALGRAGWAIVQRAGGLWNRADIQTHTGLSPQRFHDLTRQVSFPEPLTEIGGRPVWLAADVKAYRTRRDSPDTGA